MYNKMSGFSDEINKDVDIQFTVLNKLGIKYFEPRGINGTNVYDLTIDEAKALKEKMDKYGIEVSSIGSPIGKIKITDDFESHKEKLIHTIQIAKILGSKYIRIFSFFIPDGEYDKYKDEVLRRMKEMANIAEEMDIMLLHENEKGIYGDVADRCKEIFDYVNSPNLRGVFDMANFVQCGETTYPYAFNLLRPHIEYMHIKDALYSDGSVVPPGYGDGKVKEIIGELKASGYDGFYSMEPHLGSFEGLADLELTDEMEKLPEGGEGTFTLAFNAFMKILEG